MILVSNIKKYKNEINWLRIGSVDRTTFILTLIVIVFSAIALIIWALVIEDDLTRYKTFIPDTSVALLAAYGIAFPVFNSVCEEFIARAVLFDGFSAIFRNMALVIISQAVIFSLWHFQGFPGGFIGIIMVFIWSIFLGIIRHRANGILPPVVAHFFADLTIAIILCFVLA